MIKSSESEDLRGRYRRVIENIDNLPSLPAIVTKLLQIVNSADSSADDAAVLIQKDPALTSKMIRLANSAFYGIPRSISSVNSAVVILGFNTIRSLVLSASVMKMFCGPKYQAIDKERFWKHSVVCAMCARIIVRYFMNIRMMDPESAFCAGILHDIGKLIFNGMVRIDGDFQGEIFGEGSVDVGESAMVKANIVVNEAIITGLNLPEELLSKASTGSTLSLSCNSISSIKTIPFLIIIPTKPSTPTIATNPKVLPDANIPKITPISNRGMQQTIISGFL